MKNNTFKLVSNSVANHLPVNVLKNALTWGELHWNLIALLGNVPLVLKGYQNIIKASKLKLELIRGMRDS